MQSFVASSKLKISSTLLLLVPLAVAGGGLGFSGMFSYRSIKRQISDEFQQYLNKPLPISFRPYQESFDTQKIKSYEDVIDLKPAECFEAFFPGAEFKRPIRSHTKPFGVTAQHSTTPNITTYPIVGDKVGCSISKIVQAKTTEAFVYRTETVAKNKDTGFVASIGTSNLKEKGKGDYEMWIMFLRKKNNRWTVVSGLALHGQWDKGSSVLSKDNKYPTFFFTKPSPGLGKSEWKAYMSAHKLNTVPDSDVGRYEAEWFRSQNTKNTNTYVNHIARIWIYDTKDTTTSPKYELFGQGSHARHNLFLHFSPSQSSRQESFTFLSDSKLDAKGIWHKVPDYCKKNKSLTSMTAFKYSIKAICFPHREKHGL